MKDAADPATAAPMFSRTPGRDVLGKLDDKLPDIRVPHQAKLDGEARAHELGMDLTGYIREIYYEAIYGAKHVAMLYEQRMQRASGKGGHSLDALPVVDGARPLPTFLRSTSK